MILSMALRMALSDDDVAGKTTSSKDAALFVQELSLGRRGRTQFVHDS